MQTMIRLQLRRETQPDGPSMSMSRLCPAQQ